MNSDIGYTRLRSLRSRTLPLVCGLLIASTGAALADTPREQKAIVQNGYGGIDVLKLETVPVLEPGPNQVLIRIHAAAINPTDWKSRAGAGDYAPAAGAPNRLIPGADVAGVIEKPGTGVTAFKAGDSIFAIVPRDPGFTNGALNGAYSEFALAPVSTVVAKPKNVTYEQAAGLGIATVTGVRAVTDTRVGKGQRVLVTGAGGGVGSIAVQAAKAKGAYVIGTASARHTGFLRSIGADEVVDYTKVKFEEQVRNVDAVIDTVGDIDNTATRALVTLKKGGRYISVAARNMDSKCAAAGVLCAPRPTAATIMSRDILDEVYSLASTGQLNVNVDKSFPLDQAGQAHLYGEQGRTQGKISLIVNPAEAGKK